MTSRTSDDGFGTCRRCGADLADDAAFCAECGAPTYAAAAPTEPRPRTTPARPWWMPVAIIVGGLAAIGGGAFLAVALGDRDPVATDPSLAPSTSAAASASATSSAGPSEEPTPSPSPTPAQAAVIPNRSIVGVATDALNLRQQPREDAAVLAELSPAYRLFTIGEPTDVGELRWYRVAVVADEGCFEGCHLIGYVATPLAADEDAWIDVVDIDCPASPMSAEALSALAAFEALHCYGRTELVVTGTVDTPCCSPPNPIEYSPAWLAAPNTPAFLRFAGSPGVVVAFRAHPDANLETPERGDVVRVTGHFEDPAATSCRASVADDVEDPVELPDPARLILDCRATFVWTDYEVTGFEDLGPCCGAAPPSARIASGSRSGRIVEEERS